jgi:tRNA threonylcarbamoyladenosine biosynthesis protein TsaB
MLVAAVDTATLTLSCALVELSPSGPSLLAERTEHSPARPPPGGPAGGHGVKLPGALKDLLVAADLKLPDIEAYAVGLGPGSFTGLRIGLATWKGLAYANRRPIAGVSSLAAMAAQAAEHAPAGALLVPLLDARKGEVYAGFYRAAAGRIETVDPEAALAPTALLDRLAGLGAAVGFGEGYQAFRVELATALPPLAGGPATPSAFQVAALAAPRLAGAPFDQKALSALEPHYVRPSEAELKFPHGLGPGAAKA